jgi:hypothetical protein
MAQLSPILEHERRPLFLAVTVILLGVAAWAIVGLRRQRFPDAPWLRVSKKPGSLGRLEDHAVFLQDSSKILDVGWEKYSKHGINYMLDTPEGPRYIVAQKYFDELVRAPDTHVSALAASNTVYRRQLFDQRFFRLL